MAGSRIQPEAKVAFITDEDTTLLHLLLTRSPPVSGEAHPPKASQPGHALLSLHGEPSLQLVSRLLEGWRTHSHRSVSRPGSPRNQLSDGVAVHALLTRLVCVCVCLSGEQSPSLFGLTLLKLPLSSVVADCCERSPLGGCCQDSRPSSLLPPGHRWQAQARGPLVVR